MPELKTSKEITVESYENMDDVVDGDEQLEGYNKGWRVGFNAGVIAFSLKTKDNAIKWIKELRKECPKGISPMRVVGKNRLHQIEFIEHWIKHFFNITEEDLKEK